MTDTSEARERVLAVAERLFAEKGYRSVTLRDIANEVGIRHTSLYHHVPGGKEALFIKVTERTLERHREGLTDAIGEADQNIGDQLYAAADWLLSQPPMDLVRMTYADMPAIDPTEAERLFEQPTTLRPAQFTLRWRPQVSGARFSMKITSWLRVGFWA